MSDTKAWRFPFAKIVIVMAVAFLVGLGLCGLDVALGSYGIGKTGQEFNVGPLDAVTIWLMALSALGLVVLLIVWALSAILGGIAARGENKGMQKLFGENDKPNRDGKV